MGKSAIEQRHAAVVVEDEYLIRMEMADALRSAGWSVGEFASGEAAIEYLKTNPDVELLLTDIRFPGTASGWDVAKAYRRHDSHVAVVYCSGGHPDPSKDVEDCEHLIKPFGDDLLLEASASAIRKIHPFEPEQKSSPKGRAANPRAHEDRPPTPHARTSH